MNVSRRSTLEVLISVLVSYKRVVFYIAGREVYTCTCICTLISS